MVSEEESGDKRVMIFTYGTLKRGFSNHPLMEQLMASGDAVFLRTCRTALNYPLVCGPYRVPFLINLPGCGHHRVLGELYSVSTAGLARLDVLEGTARGHYQRLPIRIESADSAEAEAYYAHSSYGLKLWNKDGRKGFPAYSHELAIGYVKRSDRPHHLSFLDHIHSFISDPLTLTC